MLEEVAASLAVSRTAAGDCLAQTATGFTPHPPEHDQAQVTPPRVAQTTPIGATAASMEDEEGGPPGFGTPEATANADMFSTPPREDRTVDVTPPPSSPVQGTPPRTGPPVVAMSDPSDAMPTPGEAAWRLARFTEEVQLKRRSPLLASPPRQKAATKRPLPIRSR
jgi:hypothetical protein